jgi:F-type H+-transporting ATPase subunit epsilon
MARLKLDIVTGDRTVFSEEVDVVVAPGEVGELAILPQHAALMTTLTPGEIRIVTGSEEVHIATGGGFMEVLDNNVVILADTAEHAEEIDDIRAEAARQRAIAAIRDVSKQSAPGDLRAAEAALRRSQIRLKVVRRRRQGMPANQ